MQRMNKVKDVKRRARKIAQKPGAVQVIPDKRKKPLKKKYTIHDYLKDIEGFE